MKVTLERLPESRVLLDIEVDADRLEKSLQVAYKRVANRARIPGFRPGKAPRPIVERMIGREGLIREALDDLLPNAYNEALEGQAIDAVDQPELELVELDPVRFKATVPVRHSVDLGDYRAITVEREAFAVTPEMIDEQIDQLRQRYASQVPVERPVQWSDVLIADVVSTVNGEDFVEDRDAEFPLREGESLLVPGLADAFVGMTAGSEKEIDLAIPDDFHVERFKGKTAHFTLTVKEVKELVLPDADDELAQQVNATEFPTMDALRQRIESEVQEGLRKAAESNLQQKAVDRMIEIATLEYPRVYVEREIDSLVRDNVGNDRDRYLGYLAHLGQTEADYRASLSGAAELRVKRSLVLSTLAEAEGINVSDEDISAEIDRLLEPAGENVSALRGILDNEEGRATIRRGLVSDRTLERLTSIVAVDAAPGAPAAPSDESEAEAAPRPRRTRKKKEDAE